jgi:outer membrane protein
MNKVVLSLLIILTIAVAALFALHFKYHTELNRISSQVIKDDTISKRDLKIAYVDLDSIQEHYDYYKEKMTDFEKRKEVADRDLNGAYQKIEGERQGFIQRGNSITQVEAENFQREYTRKMQNLESQRKSMENDIQSDGVKTMEELRKKINVFLQDYNKSHGYSYIFSYSSGVNFLFYKDTIYNITPEVVKGLNEAYDKVKAKK